VTATPPHDRWTARDRFLAAAFAVYALVCTAHNYARTSPRAGADARTALAILGMVFVVFTVLFFASEVVRRRRSIETLGFTVGTWPSSVLTVVVGAYVGSSLVKRPPTEAFAAGIAVPVLAVFVEEMLYRPVLITFLQRALGRVRASWVLAVVLSAAIWTVGHVPSKSPSMLVGLFISGVLVGALYAWSGTNVAGYVLHALANSGTGGAVIMFVLCLVLAVWGLNERRAGRDRASPAGRAAV
jgi:membrane protease YdiL (CAAX protease family)